MEKSRTHPRQGGMMKKKDSKAKSKKRGYSLFIKPDLNKSFSRIALNIYTMMFLHSMVIFLLPINSKALFFNIHSIMPT